ncbi:hypothetical protein [Haladaptatus sp. NG-WS-4]
MTTGLQSPRPLAVVDLTLIYSRLNYPDIDRAFWMPSIPVLPVVGVLVNLAPISNLPSVRVVVGAALTIGLLVVYLVWGVPDVEELGE